MRRFWLSYSKPNHALEPTAYSARSAPASGSGSPRAFGWLLVWLRNQVDTSKVVLRKPYRGPTAAELGAETATFSFSSRRRFIRRTRS